MVDVLADGIIVQCKWKKKIDADNSIPDIDYDETLSTVLRYSNLRLVFALPVQLNLDICHLDVSTALLDGFLEANVYMQKPVGLECSNADNKVIKLKSHKELVMR